MNPLIDKQLNAFADYLLEKGRHKDTYFESLYALVGGCLKNLEVLAEAKGFKNKPSLLAIKSHQAYAIDGFLDLKKKHAAKIHGLFVHWILSRNRLLEVFKHYRDQFACFPNLGKRGEIISDRLSDLLIDTHHTFPMERLNDTLLTLKGRAYLFHQLIRKKQNTLAKRLFTPDLLEACYLKEYTPLMTAAKAKNEEMLIFLISKGAGLEEKSSKGKTALWYALRARFKAGFSILRSNGANLYIKSNNNLSILHIAVLNEDTPLIKELLQDKKFDINEKTKTGNCLLRYTLKTQTEVIDLILKDPRYKKTPFTSGDHLMDGSEIQGCLHPKLPPFSILMRFLCLRYGITHSFKMMDVKVTYGAMFLKQVVEDVSQSVEEYIQELNGVEKSCWEKALEVVKWGQMHAGDLEKKHSEAPYGIVAYTPIIHYSSSSRHAVSVVISKSALKCYVGNRNLSPYGIQVLSSISLDKMVSYVKKTLSGKYRSFERLISQAKSKFRSISPVTLPHKIQTVTNCTILAIKLNFESVLLALPESAENARIYYKRFTHFDRIRTLKKVLESIKEIEKLSNELNIFRKQLVDEGIVIEPVLEKIFFKSIKKGDIETLKLLLPLSPFKRDGDIYLLEAYIHQQESIFNLLFRPTPLSLLLKSFDFTDQPLRELVRQNVELFLRIEDPTALLDLYIKAFNKGLIIDVLKERVLKIDDLDLKLQRLLNAKKFAERSIHYPSSDETTLKLFESLGLDANSALFSFYR